MKKAAEKTGKNIKTTKVKKSKKKNSSSEDVRVVQAEIVDAKSELQESNPMNQSEYPFELDKEAEYEESEEPSQFEDSSHGPNEESDIPEETEFSKPPRAKPSKNLPTVAQKSIVSSDPLVTYLNEVRKYPLLTREQELEIAKKYFDTKDPIAAQTLVQSNLRFVVKVAAEYSKFGSKMIDLIQEGNIGLMHAVREFNPYKGTRLITYAVWWIRGYIQEFLMRQYSMVRIGTTQNQRKLFYQLQKQKERLDSVEFETNIDKISEKLGIPVDEIRDMAQRLSQRDVALDKPVFEDSPTSYGDLQNDTSSLNLEDKVGREEEVSILKKKLEELRPDLNEREKILLEERILNEEPLTLQEIGEKYGITREAVRQAEVRLMKKIKSKMGVD